MVMQARLASLPLPLPPPPCTHLGLQRRKLSLDLGIGRRAQQHKLAATLEGAEARVLNQVGACGHNGGVGDGMRTETV